MNTSKKFKLVAPERYNFLGVETLLHGRTFKDVYFVLDAVSENEPEKLGVFSMEGNVKLLSMDLDSFQIGDFTEYCPVESFYAA